MIVGAEGVTESGGVINKVERDFHLRQSRNQFTTSRDHVYHWECYLAPISQIGTYQMAVMAKTLNKPFYIVAESFKFVRMYPLNQGDLPNDEKVQRLNTAACIASYVHSRSPVHISQLQ